MEAILCAALGLAFVALHRFSERGPEKSRRAAWQAAAEACHLERIEPPRLGRRDLKGASGTLEVRMSHVSGIANGRPGTRIVVNGTAARTPPFECPDDPPSTRVARLTRAIEAALESVRWPPEEPADAIERALVAALEHADEEVRRAAVDRLGQSGTAYAVPLLRRAEARGATDGELVRAVNAAIASIQSRLVGAGRGQLGVASPEGGLSIIEADPGGVSLERPQD
jgi:hypothetical protein